MTAPTLLGNLSTLHDLLLHLAEQTPDALFGESIHPELGSVAHCLGGAIYRELYWLREMIQGDADLSRRVEHLFVTGMQPLVQQCQQLPPKDHLLNWASEILDHNLMLLANPGMLPKHPLLEEGAILHFIAQEHARSYERMISLRNLQQLDQPLTDYRVGRPLEAALPRRDAKDVAQGVYRIGARADAEAYAYDNELPAQMIELSKYAIAQNLITNAEFLAFMQDGGYGKTELWSDDSIAWLKGESRGAPLHWRQDPQGHWYGLGIHGPFDLMEHDPIFGVTHHEAAAFAAWASQQPETAGAVLQHEFQWEVAARTQTISHYGRVWEWCANLFEPYSEYQPPPSRHYATADFDGLHRSLRGGSLHTQPVLRRPGFRNRAYPHCNSGFAGIRLVFPPSKDFWLKE